MFSNNSRPAYRKRYLGAGAVRFLDKSAEFDQLPQAVSAAATPLAPIRSLKTALHDHRNIRSPCPHHPPAPVPATPRAGSVAPIPTQCSTCHLRDLCLPCGLTGSETQRLDGLMFGRRRVAAGEALYREGDRFQFIYAVRSGTFKSSLNRSADGREQVSGFHMAGELMGLDGVANGRMPAVPRRWRTRRSAPFPIRV